MSVYDKYTFLDRHFDLSARKQLEVRDVVSWRDVTSQGLALNLHGTVAGVDPVRHPRANTCPELLAFTRGPWASPASPWYGSTPLPLGYGSALPGHPRVCLGPCQLVSSPGPLRTESSSPVLLTPQDTDFTQKRSHGPNVALADLWLPRCSPSSPQSPH